MAVYVLDTTAVADDAAIGEHPELVAGVMISNDTTATGVAPHAQLYSSATGKTISPGQPEAALSAQHIISETGAELRAINFSFGEQLVDGHIIDGNSLLTLFTDWSAAAHNVLYVKSNNEEDPGGIPIATDAYNGIVVAGSTKNGGVYRQVADNNVFDEVPIGRSTVSLLRPGTNIQLTGLGNSSSTLGGTSFAAPHVTGTVALLQQFANLRIDAGTLRWDQTR